MKKTGTITKGTTTHRVYEAILTHPNEKFTAKDIWIALNKDYSHIKYPTVGALMTSKKSYIRELFHEVGNAPGTNAKQFVRKLSPPTRPIYDPTEHKRVKPNRLPSSSKQKSSTPSEMSGLPQTTSILPESSPKSESDPTEVVTTDQIAKSFIYYIERLKEKIRDLGISLADQKSRSATNLNLLRQEVKAQKVKIEKLEQENQSLRKLQRSNHSTFNMSEIARFTRNG